MPVTPESLVTNRGLGMGTHYIDYPTAWSVTRHRARFGGDALFTRWKLRCPDDAAPAFDRDCHD